MNAAGVALAADSAVSTDLGGRKVFRTASKLFMLSKYEPVGVMIFGSSDVNGMPWETVIKAFREHLAAARYDHLENYADKFFEWLTGHQYLFTANDELETLNLIINAQLRAMHAGLRKYQDLVRDNQGSPEDIREAAVAYLERARTFVAARDRIPDVSAEWVSRNAVKVRPLFESLSREILMDVAGVDEAALEPLADLPELILGHQIVTPLVSGVVFAGFGELEYTPRLSEWKVDLVLDGQLHGLRVNTYETHPNMVASVVPFAETGMVDTFLNGVSPSVRLQLTNTVPAVLDDLVDRFRAALGAQATDEVVTIVQSLRDELQDNLAERLNTGFKAQAESILRTVGVLPKGELAAMAEALVELTKFKQRVSSDQVANVDGEIDVAVISKGDGFVWIKRKQYFVHDHNPHWRTNYYRDGPALADRNA